MRIFPGIVAVLSFVLFFMGYPAVASPEDLWYQRIMIPSSPNPVGSGARALGMGGAFIAIADDATAASWNPGGLVQLEKPEISCAGAFVKRYENTNLSAFPESGNSFDVQDEKLNYLSLAYPFHFLNRNMTVSLNYQHMFNFDKKVMIEFTKNYETYRSENSYLMNQSGDLYSLSPAFALQLTQDFSVGFAVNIWKDGLFSNSWRVDYSEDIQVHHSTGFLFSKTLHSDDYAFEGTNFTVGFLWDINRIFTLGGVFKSGFEADLHHTYQYNSDQNSIWNETRFFSDEKINMPMSFGIGVSIRLSDAFSMGLDIYRTLWDDYYIISSSGRRISPVSGRESNQTEIEPTTQIRLGMEYLLIREKTVIPFRCGLFYDPEPAIGNPDDFWGITLGSGLVYQNLVFDIAYQYRFGRDVREVELGGLPSTKDIDEHTILCSIVIHL